MGNRLIVIERCVGLKVYIVLGIHIGAYLLLYITRSIYYTCDIINNRPNIMLICCIYKKRGKWFKKECCRA